MSFSRVLTVWSLLHLLCKGCDHVCCQGLEQSSASCLLQQRATLHSHKWMDTEKWMDTLGLEGQSSDERWKCMQEKEARPPTGLLDSHLGISFASQLQVDDLTNYKDLHGAVCEREGGCGLFNLTHPFAERDRACVREVPKLIHFVWLDHPMPENYAKNVARVMAKNPDRQVLLWLNENATDLSALTKAISNVTDGEATTRRLHVMNIEEYKDHFLNWDMIQNEQNVGGRSDFIRFEAIYLFGGIYMDTDVYAKHGFNEYGSVFKWPFVAYSDPKGYGNLCNCIFSAEKQSPLIGLAMRGWRDNYLHHRLGSAPPLGCPVLTAAFQTYNHPEILMIGEPYMFKGPVEGVEPIITMSFDGSWLP